MNFGCLLEQLGFAQGLAQRFLAEYQIRSKGNDGLASVFGHNDGDLGRYPRRTSLQRMMLDPLHDGGKLRTGGMFLLPEHLSRFGTQFNRRQTTLKRVSHHA